MKISNKIKKRIMLGVAVLTLVTLIHMIWVKVSAGGYNLITMNSHTGWHIATWYNASVVIFVICAVIMGSWMCVNFMKNKKNSDNSKNIKKFSKSA